MGKVNRERLAEYLGELQRKEDTNDRYVAGWILKCGFLVNVSPLKAAT
jgi:hypothetical protein